MKRSGAGQGALSLLIDGYNVVAPTGPSKRFPDPRWLDRQRTLLVGRLREHLPAAVRCRTCVVFDAVDPPRDRPHQFLVEGIEVRFAVGYPEADDLLEELIAAHSVPKKLAVVSSDHRVQAAAKRRGSTPLDSQPWLDDLLDGIVRLSGGIPFVQDGLDRGDRATEKPTETDSADVASWMKEFGFDPEPGSDRPS
jgi:predicted RNA-binding protein with PIN domain